MPGFVLDAAATTMCPHLGKVEPTAPSPRVTVSGRPAVTQPAPYMVVGCPGVPAAPLPPCVTASWVTASTRVRSMGQPVLLHTSEALTNNMVPLTVVPGQTRVKAQ